MQILGDEVRIEQIVINLLRNSLDAVRECDEKRIWLRLRQEGPTAFVEVSDSGPGLDLENLAQVFDPFFTTKSTGEGIGLGLTVSFTLAKEMNGKLTAANHPSGGACFTLTLPRRRTLQPGSRMNDRKNSSVIFVDDEEPMRVSAKQWLELADYSVTTYADGASALESFKPQSIDVLVTDLKMPEVDGFDVLERVLAIDAELPVIVVTAHGDVDAAVTAMKQGAYDFIEKPFSPEQLAESVLRASEKRHLVLENRSLRQKLTGSDVLQSRLIGNCKAIGNLRSTISDYAETGANILILGETGTGKEIVARCLHDLGPNPNENFVAVNCGAIPEHLFESEFFALSGRSIYRRS